jgi:hypothetical protein
LANGTLIIANANLNFNNTATVNVSVIANGTTQANISFSANGTQLGIPAINTALGTMNGNFGVINSTFSTTNTTFGTLNTNITAAATEVSTYVNGTVVLGSANLNFNNTATVNVIGTANGTGQANISFSANGTALGVPAINAALGTMNGNFGTINSALSTTNTTFGTVNSTFGTLNTNITGASTEVSTYVNGTLVLGSANLNFNNTATVNVSGAGNGTGQSNVSFTANVTALGIPAINAALATTNGNFTAINSAFSTSNTTFGTVNSTFGTVNTAVTAAGNVNIYVNGSAVGNSQNVNIVAVNTSNLTIVGSTNVTPGNTTISFDTCFPPGGGGSGSPGGANQQIQFNDAGNCHRSA